jgi:hypothetical protein
MSGNDDHSSQENLECDTGEKQPGGDKIGNS